MLKSVSLSIGTLLLMFIDMASMSNNILPLNKLTVKTSRHKRQAMVATNFEFETLKEKMKALIDEYVRPTFPINVHVKLDPVNQINLEKLSKEFDDVLRQTMTFPVARDEALKFIAEELDRIFIKYVSNPGEVLLFPGLASLVKKFKEKFPNEEPFINNIPGLLAFLQQMKPDANGELHFDQNNPKIRFIIHEILLHMEDLSKVDPFNPNILRFIQQNQHLFGGFRSLDDIIIDFDIKVNVRGQVELQEIIAAMHGLMRKFGNMHMMQMKLPTTFSTTFV